MKIAISLVLLFLAASVQAEVCFDTYTVPIDISTMDYVAPESTTTSTPDLLKALYQAMYDRDFNYQGWHIIASQWWDTLGDIMTFQDNQWAAEDKYAALLESAKNNVQISSPAIVWMPPQPGTGLSATYYDNMDFTGSTVTRVDPGINFDWGLGSPDPAISSDTFSARWVGKIVPRYNGPYIFYVQSNDAARLWIGGQLLVNDWTPHSLHESSGTLTLFAGQTYAVRMEYYEGGNTATVKLSWESAGQPKEVVPGSALYAQP